MAKAKLSGASVLSNFKFDTSTYISLKPISSLKKEVSRASEVHAKSKDKAKS
jgi:hypothetical protein